MTVALPKPFFSAYSDMALIAASHAMPLNGPEFTSMLLHGCEWQLGLDGRLLRIAIASAKSPGGFRVLYFLANS